MAIGNSGYFDLTGNYGMTLRVHWSETYDIETNQSVVNITSLQLASSNYYGYTYYLSGSVSIENVEAISMSSTSGANGVRIHSRNTFETVTNSTGTVSNIEHDDEGNKTAVIAVNVRGYTINGDGGNGWRVSGSYNVKLTTIPRKSTLDTINGVLGTSQMLNVTQKSTSFTHTITYSCGDDSETICEKSNRTSISWTPPIDLAWQNPNGTSVTVKFTISTYNGDSFVGSNTLSITCAIPADIAPTCSLIVYDETDLDSKYGAMVQGYSKFHIKVENETAYGSPITLYEINANGTKYYEPEIVTDVLKSAGTLSVDVTVVDKRGRAATANMNISVLAYTAPTITLFKIRRCEANGAENDGGEFAQITFSGNVTALNDKNKAVYKLQYKKSADSAYTSVNLTDFDNLYSVNEGTYIFAADSSFTYEVKLSLNDDLAKDSKAIPLSTGFTIMHFAASGTAVGIGKVAEKDYTLDIGFAVDVNDNRITGLGTPINDTDAVPKAYVDRIIALLAEHGITFEET